MDGITKYFHIMNTVQATIININYAIDDELVFSKLAVSLSPLSLVLLDCRLFFSDFTFLATAPDGSSFSITWSSGLEIVAFCSSITEL